MYDVIIVGGSFAGLAVAMQLRGYRVLIIDQYPIGARQMSACGTPLSTAQAVGAEGAVQEVHGAFVLHAARQEIRLALRDPYVTFDYLAFCQSMLAQTDAEVWQARASTRDASSVTTDRGVARARFVVDATGWRALHGRSGGAAASPRPAGYGIETELPLRLDLKPGLHFYFDKHIVRNGYAWAFPCGETTRFGIGTFDAGQRLGRLLDQFLDRFGLRAGSTHGGVLAIDRLTPTIDGVLLVGDAAGQCLPVSGEGIRTAIFHGIHCGHALATALRGTLSDDAARAQYRLRVQETERFHRRLLQLQALVARTPDSLLAVVGRLCAQPALTHRVMSKYLHSTGWVPGERTASCCVASEKVLANA